MAYKINQLGTTSMCSSVQIGGGKARKIEPGEIVDPGDYSVGDELLVDVFDRLVETEKMAVTNKPATRPVEFASIVEANLSSPSYVPKNKADEIRVQRVKDRIAEQMAQPEPKAKRGPKKQTVDTDESNAEFGAL